MISLNLSCVSSLCFQGPPKECFTVKACSAFSGILDPEAQVSSCSIKSFHRTAAERGKEGEQYLLNYLYIDLQLKYYFLKGHNLFWRYSVITTSMYFHHTVTLSVLHCTPCSCCFCKILCYQDPYTIITVLFNLSQPLQS